MIRQFIKMESLGGLLLALASLLALLFANSPLRTLYTEGLNAHFFIGINTFSLSKPILLWINDGLMAIFFLLIGLELKREMCEGQLSHFNQVILPGIAALGGILLPSCIYVLFNFFDPKALAGWAIPTATDIAFALSVLGLLTSHVPISLKIFLMTLAIFDDLAAIVIIAFFYTSHLSLLSLLFGAVTLFVLICLNYYRVFYVSLYLLIGLILWICVLKSGVHATLAGIFLAMTIPLKILKSLEKALHGWVSFLILPLFAFANAGLDLTGITVNDIFSHLSLGIALGLFLGKQCGVFSFTYLAIKCNIATLPENTTWTHIYGVSLLCGIGFTMSLFISTLAFEENLIQYHQLSRLGILMGSLTCALAGYLLLKLQPPRHVRDGSPLN